MAGLGCEKRPETFSSCFNEAEYDERPFINSVLKKTGSEPNFVFVDEGKLFADMEDIIWHQEEPYSTLSIFPQWHIMKRAREKGVKVLLTGQGGDETLGGYHKYYFYLFADLINSLNWKRAADEIRIFRGAKGEGRGWAGPVFRIIASYAVPEIFKKISKRCGARRTPPYLNRDFTMARTGGVSIEKRFSSILNNDLYNALKISPLPSLLHIDDRSSMAHSVESRAPFLDYRLVEYLFTLGPEYKIRGGMTKYILRMSLEGTLPESVRTRKDKMGFATPLEKWLKTTLREKVREIINSREFLSRPYFDRKGVSDKFENFINGADGGAHYALWGWVNLELWLRKFIDGK